MYVTMMISQEFTNPEINELCEIDRKRLVATETYRNMSDEDKLMTDEYIEICESVEDFFLKNTNIHRYIDETGKFLILQIIFSSMDVYLSWLNTPEHNAKYFIHLNDYIWQDIFGVGEKYIWIETEEFPDKFISYNQANEFFLKKFTTN